MTRRSILFSPGDDEALLRNAATTDADCLVFDLEDAVAPAAKSTARTTVRSVLTDPDFDPDAEVCVRVNPTAIAMDEDLEELTAGGLPRIDSVMLPKAGTVSAVETLGSRLAEHDLNVPIIPLLESAAGILNASSIAETASVDAIVFGAEDLAADIGAERSEDGTEVLHAREHVVLAASAQGIDAIDTVYTQYTDVNGLREETEFARQLGFDGKLAIHPDQVGVINEAFTPGPSDIEWAKRVLAADEDTESGVFEVDGQMIDAPLLAQAKRILERARAGDRI